MLFSWPLMCAIQEISARIGRVTGRGIAGNLKRHYPLGRGLQRRTGLLVLANVINLRRRLGSDGRGAQIAYRWSGTALCRAVRSG